MSQTIELGKMKRLGRFFVSVGAMYHNADNLAETLAEIKFLPLSVVCNGALEVYEFVGISSQFDLIAHGSKIPFYELQPMTVAGVEVIKVTRKEEAIH